MVQYVCSDMVEAAGFTLAPGNTVGYCQLQGRIKRRQAIPASPSHPRSGFKMETIDSPWNGGSISVGYVDTASWSGGMWKD